MSLLLILIILVVVLGGGGFYAGGPRVGGGLAGLILLILVRCEKAADASELPGPFSAGHLGRVASRDARCAAIPHTHRCWLGESPPRRSDRLSPRGKSRPPRATGSPTASAHRRPAPSTRGTRQATWPARIDAGGWYRHPGHDPPLVPEVDRPEVRRQSSTTARPPDDAPSDRRTWWCGWRARIRSGATPAS